MERRNLVVTPKLAQKLYNSGNPTLREIALLSVGTANLRTYGSEIQSFADALDWLIER